MIELARQRLGEDVDLQVADLSLPLPFGDGAFDDVVVSLVLHYLARLESTAVRTAARAHTRWPSPAVSQPPHDSQSERT
ncbi:class I SAM-dependent methyltransferase [Actinoplanes xinjiangensis]|uniref:class I SAM-dependent methyltransferase n=1 Tax=Actinoplanes xinjiangensis TaxID=512350 RepID=UPI00342F781E